MTSVNDSASVSWSGLTEPTTMSWSPPAVPAQPALTPNAATFVRARSTPIEAADVGWSGTAIIARPHRPRARFQPTHETTVVTATTTR